MKGNRSNGQKGACHSTTRFAVTKPLSGLPRQPPAGQHPMRQRAWFRHHPGPCSAVIPSLVHIGLILNLELSETRPSRSGAGGKASKSGKSRNGRGYLPDSIIVENGHSSVARLSLFSGSRIPGRRNFHQSCTITTHFAGCRPAVVSSSPREIDKMKAWSIATIDR